MLQTLGNAAMVLAFACLSVSAQAQTDTPMAQQTPGTITPSGYDVRDDVFYQIMPISWRHGPSSAPVPDIAAKNRFGNFRGMSDSISYLKQVGVTAVWMTPIFPSPGYHGYQHGPADQVNPWFGEEREFWAFVNEAKAAGIKVYLDLVTYGVNQNSPQYKQASEDRRGEIRSLFAFEDRDQTKPFGYSFKTWTGETVRFVHWDLRNAKARQQVIDWSRHWLDPNGDGDCSDGVAGFRLDHVWNTYKPERKIVPDGWGYNIDSFWMEWKQTLVRMKPDVFTFAEQAKWETWGTDLMPAHDATFTKPFEFAAREALQTENAAKLYESMASACEAVPPGRTFLAILGDHDVDRLATTIGADSTTKEGRAKAAAAILLLQPFTPVIYYGDEIGMLGKAGKFGSDSNDIPRREPMKWLATEGEPMSRYHALDPRTIKSQYSQDGDGRSVAEQEGRAGSLLETYRTLIKLRRDNIALRRGRYEPLTCDNRAVWRFRRVHQQQTLEVAINLSGVEVPAGKDLTDEIPAYGYVMTEVNLK